ncbi:MAG TPA: hypothetical protein VMX56_02150 [Anaerolineales bacterium]|nr:hypothetical protein [Anaerolineales bacterium]
MSAQEHRRTRVPGKIDSKAIGTFIPTYLASCSLWLDANQLVGYIDDDPIDDWSDMSGEAHHFTQVDAAKKPTYQSGILNGFPAVLFDGGDELSRAEAVVGRQYATVWVVAHINDATTHGVFFGVGNSANGWKMGVGLSTLENDGNDLIILFDGIRWNDSNDLIGTGGHLLTVKFDNYTPLWWIDGVFLGSAAGTPNAPAGLSLVGSGYYANRYLSDYICEIVACTTAVSADEQALMDSYLMSKYAI